MYGVRLHVCKLERASEYRVARAQIIVRLHQTAINVSRTKVSPSDKGIIFAMLSLQRQLRSFKSRLWHMSDYWRTTR